MEEGHDQEGIDAARDGLKRACLNPAPTLCVRRTGASAKRRGFGLFLVLIFFQAEP
jgi:hypothetical protein